MEVLAVAVKLLRLHPIKFLPYSFPGALAPAKVMISIAVSLCRSIAVHPSLPYILSSSDDMLIKLWDWEKGWICTQIFEGHSHYVMQARHHTTIACGVLPTDECHCRMAATVVHAMVYIAETSHSG